MDPNAPNLEMIATRICIRGTSFQNDIEQVTGGFAANSSGTYVLPIRYIFVSKFSSCFWNFRKLRDSRTS